MPVVRKILSEFVERHSSFEVARGKRDTRVHPLQEEIWNERGIHRSHAKARFVQALRVRNSFMCKELFQASQAKTTYGDSRGRQSETIRVQCVWHWFCRGRLPQAPYDQTQRSQKLRVHCLLSKISLQRSSQPTYERPCREIILL